jgi:hypothetical protein
MRSLAGPSSQIHFTSLSKSSSTSLSEQFRSKPGSEDSKLTNVQCHQQGILDLMRSQNISLDQICLLDPKAEHALSPSDGDGTFYWFLFGVRTLFFKNSYLFFNLRRSPSINTVRTLMVVFPFQGILGTYHPSSSSSESLPPKTKQNLNVIGPMLFL